RPVGIGCRNWLSHAKLRRASTFYDREELARGRPGDRGDSALLPWCGRSAGSQRAPPAWGYSVSRGDGGEVRGPGSGGGGGVGADAQGSVEAVFAAAARDSKPRHLRPGLCDAGPVEV